MKTGHEAAPSNGHCAKTVVTRAPPPRFL